MNIFGYVNFYEEYQSIEVNVNEAASIASTHSVSNNICSNLGDAITNINELNNFLSSENYDFIVISFANNLSTQLSTLQSIQDFLSSDYVSAEQVYKDLKSNLDLLKQSDENLKILCDDKPHQSQYKTSTGEDDVEKYKKKLREWQTKVLSLKGDCQNLKGKIDEYLFYLDSINICIPTEGKSNIKAPSSNKVPLKFEGLSNFYDIIKDDDIDAVSSSSENIKYHSYVYQTSKGPTTVYYSIIPAALQPNLAIATDSKGNMTKKLPWKLADEVGAKYAINFSLFGGGRNERGIRDGGSGISYDGEHLFIGNHYNCDTTLYMDENGNFGYIDNTSFKSKDDVAQTLKNKNVKWAAKGFYPIIDNYKYVNNNTDNNIGSDSIRHPRTFIGQLENGDYIMGVCSGRNENDEGKYENGMTLKEVGDFVQNYATDDNGNKIRVRFLMNGDGGGSSAFVADGEKKNVSGEDRATTDIIYVGGVQV